MYSIIAQINQGIKLPLGLNCIIAANLLLNQNKSSVEIQWKCSAPFLSFFFKHGGGSIVIRITLRSSILLDDSMTNYFITCSLTFRSPCPLGSDVIVSFFLFVFIMFLRIFNSWGFFYHQTLIDAFPELCHGLVNYLFYIFLFVFMSHFKFNCRTNHIISNGIWLHHN